MRKAPSISLKKKSFSGQVVFGVSGNSAIHIIQPFLITRNPHLQQGNLGKDFNDHDRKVRGSISAETRFLPSWDCKRHHETSASCWVAWFSVNDHGALWSIEHDGAPWRTWLPRIQQKCVGSYIAGICRNLMLGLWQAFSELPNSLRSICPLPSRSNLSKLRLMESICVNGARIRHCFTISR